MTHERLAVDALRHLRGPDVERWSDLLLHNHAEFLGGCRAPDERFKDFQKHVVFVTPGSQAPLGNSRPRSSALSAGSRASGLAAPKQSLGARPFTVEPYHGGAPQEARRWYSRLIDALRRREWAEAAFAAGALSHYFSDSFMPLNTSCSEEATKVHRALEYCIAKSYGRLQHIIEHDQGGYPQLETPRSSDDWLEKMVLTGAELAHEHYDAILQHCDHERAVRDPLTGMDQECQDRIAQCVSHAVIGFARVIERAISEAEVEPPPIETTLQGFLIMLGLPLRAISDHIGDLSERMALEAALDEAQRTGKVIKNLSDEHREIRRLHAEEILRIPLHQLDQQPTSSTGTLHGSGATERFHPNHLLTQNVIPNDSPVSNAWREALRRVKAYHEAGAANSLPRRVA
jgi:hypothetical protein